MEDSSSVLRGMILRTFNCQLAVCLITFNCIHFIAAATFTSFISVFVNYCCFAGKTPMFLNLTLGVAN